MRFIKFNFLASTIVVGDKMIELGDTHILIFFTSASVYAASTCMGLEKGADLHFTHGKENLFVIVSTCDLTLRLPTCYDDFSTFVDRMTESICITMMGLVMCNTATSRTRFGHLHLYQLSIQLVLSNAKYIPTNHTDR